MNDLLTQKYFITFLLHGRDIKFQAVYLNVYKVPILVTNIILILLFLSKQMQMS